jgi:hypothetical protein
MNLMFIVNSVLLEDEKGLLANKYCDVLTAVKVTQLTLLNQCLHTHRITDHPAVAPPLLGDLIDRHVYKLKK